MSQDTDKIFNLGTTKMEFNYVHISDVFEELNWFVKLDSHDHLVYIIDKINTAILSQDMEMIDSEVLAESMRLMLWVRRIFSIHAEKIGEIKGGNDA